MSALGDFLVALPCYTEYIVHGFMSPCFSDWSRDGLREIVDHSEDGIMPKREE